MNAFDVQRREANRDLAAKLAWLIEFYPDLRFGQILVSFGFVECCDSNPMHWRDEFYLEPNELLKRVQKAIAALEGK